MANFSYRYRASDGLLQNGNVTAESRTEAFAALKAQGIKPISLTEAPAEKAAGHRPLPTSWIALSLVAAALISGGWWWLSRKEPPRPEPVRKSRPAAAAKPAKKAAPTALKAPAAPGKEEKKRQPPLEAQIYTDERGVRRYPGGLRAPTDKPKQVIYPAGKQPPLFKHHSEQAIAGLLEIAPGDLIAGDVEYGPRFTADFKASLNEPIEISPDDTPYNQKLKQAVSQTKKELQARMASGEDIAQVMTESRRELQTIFRYRNELESELRRIRSDDQYSAQDVQNFIKAANVMLEEKGAKPIVMPKVLLMKLLQRDTRSKPNR